jgi:hypothetical protein
VIGPYCLLELLRCSLAVLAPVGMSSSWQREVEVGFGWTCWAIDVQVAEPWEQGNHSTSHSAGPGIVLGEHSRCRSQGAVVGIGLLVVEGRYGLSNNRHDLQCLVECIRKKDRGRRQ